MCPKVCFCVKVGLMLCHVYILRRWRSWSLKKRRVVLLGALRTTGTRAWPECNSWIWSTSMCDGLSASVVTIPILHLRISLCILILPYPTFISQSLFIIPSFICLPSFIFSTFLGLLFGWWHKDASSDSYSIYDLARLVRVEMVDEF